MKKNPQKESRDEKALVQAMLELAQAGRSGDEIVHELGISRTRAQTLHYKLLMEKKLRVENLSFIAHRRLTVTAKGIFIPAGRLDALGLKDIFPDGTRIQLNVREGSLVIEPDSGTGRVEKKPAQTESLLPALWDDLLAGEIAMGRFDEPNA